MANPACLLQLGPVRSSLEFINDKAFDPIYLAAVEAIEEAVVNCLVAAEDMTTLRPPGRICRAIDCDRLVELMRRYKRCA